MSSLGGSKSSRNLVIRWRLSQIAGGSLRFHRNAHMFSSALKGSQTVPNGAQPDTMYSEEPVGAEAEAQSERPPPPRLKNGAIPKFFDDEETGYQYYLVPIPPTQSLYAYRFVG